MSIFDRIFYTIGLGALIIELFWVAIEIQMQEHPELDTVWIRLFKQSKKSTLLLWDGVKRFMLRYFPMFFLFLFFGTIFWIWTRK